MYTNFITEWSTTCGQVGNIAIQQLVSEILKTGISIWGTVTIVDI